MRRSAPTGRCMAAALRAAALIPLLGFGLPVCAADAESVLAHINLPPGFHIAR